MSFLSEPKYQKFAVLLVLFFFTAVSILISYPLLRKFNHSIYAEVDDNLGVLWALWWVNYAIFDLKASPVRCPFVEAPFGLKLAFPAPLNYIISLPLSSFFNNIAVFNIIEMSGFILSGLGMYVLVYYLTGSFIAGLISGAIYAFSPYHVGYSKHCLDLSQIQWFPFYLYFLFKINLFPEGRLKISDALLCALFFVLTALTNGYYTVMLILITAIYIFLKIFPPLFLWYQKTFPSFKEIILNTSRVRLGVLKVVVFLFSIFLFKQHFWSKTDHIQKAILVLIVLFAFKFVFVYSHLKSKWHVTFKRNLNRVVYVAVVLIVMIAIGVVMFNILVNEFWNTTVYPMEEYVTFTLRLIPDHFFIPPFQHPVLGEITKTFFPNFTPWDMCQYIGYGVLMLAIMAVLFWKKASLKQKTVSIFCILCLGTVIGLGLMPVMRFFGYDIFMPAYYFQRLFPFFRDMKRLALIVMLAVAVLAGFGVSNILKIVTSRIKRFIFLFSFVTLISLEYFPQPLNMELGKVPEVYRWLKAQSGDFIIAEYPFYNINEVWRNDFMFFQTIHHKKVINVPRQGSAQTKEADQFIRRATKEIYLVPKNSASALSLLGVRYILFRTDRIGFKPYFTPDSGLSFFKSFEKVDVYTISAPKANFLVNIVGELEDERGEFYPTEHDPAGKTVKWMKQDGRIELLNLEDRPLRIVFHFRAHTLKEKRTMRLELNGSRIKEFDISAEEKDYTIENLRLAVKKKNTIKLYASGTLDSLGEKAVSVGFTGMELELQEK